MLVTVTLTSMDAPNFMRFTGGSTEIENTGVDEIGVSFALSGRACPKQQAPKSRATATSHFNHAIRLLRMQSEESQDQQFRPFNVSRPFQQPGGLYCAELGWVCTLAGGAFILLKLPIRALTGIKLPHPS